MPKPPDAHVMQRLAFIRYMHDLGVEQAAKPEPYSWTAILTFHDAVELFLGLAASHHGADVRKDTKFVDYWKLIDDKIDSVRLPHSGRMGKLNDARVAFKHHGNEPTPRMIEQSCRDVDLFFEDATPSVFGIAFSEIDLAAVIPHAEAAEYVRAATRHAKAGAFPMAMAGLALAFDTLVAHYTLARSWYPGSMAIGPWPTSPLMFGESLRNARTPPSRGFAPSVEQVNNVVAEMQTAMRLIALGIDYTRYVSFQMITPPDATTINSSQPQFHVSGVMRRHLAANHFTFGRTFVIESALSAARADHLIRTRAEQLALPRGNRGDYETITWEG